MWHGVFTQGCLFKLGLSCRCCKKLKENPKRPKKITRNCPTASVATGLNPKWEWLVTDQQCRFWPHQIGMIKCITSASGLRPVPHITLQGCPYGESECVGQGRKHNSHITYLSILAFWVTLMKIALLLQGKEQVDKAILSSKMERETLTCFLCGDHK